VVIGASQMHAYDNTHEHKQVMFDEGADNMQ
jgi:hypothetical protein